MFDHLPSRLRSASRSPLLIPVLLVPLLAFVWWGRMRDLGLEFAWYGGGPMFYVYKSSDPAAFARDFPGGTEQHRYSAPMHAYRLAYSVLGIEPESLIPVFVALELVFMSAAMIALARALRPSAPPAVSVILVALVIASGARDMSFAALRQPFFQGLYHNFADGLCLLGIVMVLKRRLMVAAALLGLAFACHPAMGATAAVFALAPFAAKPRELLRRGNLAAGLVFLALAGGWAFGVLRYGSMSGGTFPSQLWSDLTRLNCFHLYPVDKGMFTTYHDRVLIPFLSFLVLVALYLRRLASEAETERKVVWGMAAMLVLAALGVLFSIVPVSTGLTKLALHRANALVLTVGLVYVVAGLWDELASGPWWRQAVAGVVLVSPFLGPPGFPLLFTLLLAVPAWRRAKRGSHAEAAEKSKRASREERTGEWKPGEEQNSFGVPPSGGLGHASGPKRGPHAEGAEETERGRREETAEKRKGESGPGEIALRQGGVAGRLDLAGTPVALAAVLVVGFHACSGTAQPVTAGGYTGLEWLLAPAVLGGVVAASLALLARRWLPMPSARALAALALVPSVIAWERGAALEAPYVARATQYKEVQVWARQHTPKSALFMVDPTIYYGWRDYSRRSSFGNLREWTYSSWLYNSDYALCQEGLRRLGEFGLGVRAYVGYKPPLAGFAALSRELRRRYYSASDQWRLDLARRYGIAYFVFENQPGGLNTRLPLVCRNSRFTVVAAVAAGPRKPDCRGTSAE